MTTTKHKNAIRYLDLNSENLEAPEKLTFELFKDEPPTSIIGRVSQRVQLAIILNKWFEGIIPAHSPLVYRQVNLKKRWADKLGIDSEELAQTGFAALTRAAQLYDNNSDTSFGAYAKPRVAGEIHNLLQSAQDKFEGNRLEEDNPFNSKPSVVELFADESLPAERVVRTLNQIIAWRGKPL